MGKLPITLLLIVAMAISAVWFWPSGTPSSSAEPQNESADRDTTASQQTDAETGRFWSNIEPISDDVAASQAWSVAMPAESSALIRAQNADFEQRFKQANELLELGDIASSSSLYQGLIEDFPHFVEPYVNLAAAQASAGNLTLARDTLHRAAKANQSTKVLFDSINKLHGLLAAQAYRNALETGTVDNALVSGAELPKVRDVATDFVQAQHIQRLNEQLAVEKQKQTSLSENSAALEQATAELLTANTQIKTLELEQQEVIQKLQAELELQREKGKVAEIKFTELQAKTNKIESDLVAKLRLELRNSEAALLAANTRLSELVVSDGEPQIAALNSGSNPVAVADIDTDAEAQPSSDGNVGEPDPVAKTTVNAAVAIELVKGWAQAWSEQDVEAYVGFYQAGYSPSADLAHQQWLEQRRIRLTNKRFIEVTVSDFLVQPKADGFDVTFTQHYRSNTLDDSITKRLSFDAADSNEWQKAKISGERIIR